MPVIADNRLDRQIKSFWKEDSHRDYFGMNHPDTDIMIPVSRIRCGYSPSRARGSGDRHIVMGARPE